MAHVLVVGGTGMLRDVCKHFCESIETVTVVARIQNRLDKLQHDFKSLSGKINPLALDYRDSKELMEKLESAIEKYGPIEIAVCWIHTSVAPDAVKNIAEVIDNKNGLRPCKFYLLLSSANADPSREKKDVSKDFAVFKNISFRTILLGFVVEQDISRWLNDDEISGGVTGAIEQDKLSSVIGSVEPWGKRP